MPDRIGGKNTLYLGLYAFSLLTPALAAGGCSGPAFTAICAMPDNATPEQQLPTVCSCQRGVSETIWNAYRRPELDLLLVIGNTPAMVKKQRALAQTFPALVSLLEGGSFDYHIGVVSTDTGSWVAPNAPWTMSAGGCDSFAGDDGQLQKTSCLDRSNGSAAAATACAAVCPDRRFLPTDGLPFVAGAGGRTNVPAALVPDPMTGRMVDYGPAYALQCMAMLGDGGCSISAPLASARLALDGHADGNREFLRPRSLLYIAFLTDGDDCSVQPVRRADNNPRTQSCTAPDANAAASCYSLGAYRCLARDVECEQPMNVVGPKTGCRERADSYLTAVDSYVRFFSALRTPGTLAVGGLWTTPALTQGGQLIVAQNPNVAGSAGLDFGSGSDAGCQSTSDATYTGKAQLRLSKLFAEVAQRVADPPSMPRSVCAPESYPDVFAPLGQTILVKWAASCLPGLPVLRPDGSPDCAVGDVPDDSPHAAPKVLLPACGTSCCAAIAGGPGPPQLDPAVVSACANEPADCFCAGPSKIPGCGAQGGSFGVWRKDNADPPPGTVVNSRCSLQCPTE